MDPVEPILNKTAMRKTVIFGVCSLAAVVSLLVLTALVGNVNLDYTNKIFISSENVDKSREETDNTFRNITYEPFTGSFKFYSTFLELELVVPALFQVCLWQECRVPLEKGSSTPSVDPGQGCHMLTVKDPTSRTLITRPTIRIVITG